MALLLSHLSCSTTEILITHSHSSTFIWINFLQRGGFYVGISSFLYLIHQLSLTPHNCRSEQLFEHHTTSSVMIFLHFVLLSASILNGAWCLPGKLPPSKKSSCPHPGLSLTNEIACVQKCWENSRYVSKCPNELDCLCKDGFFQRVRAS